MPTLVAGPFVKTGCVVSTQLGHASILETLVTRFGIQSLNSRMDAANDLSSAIQAQYLTAPQPAVTLPQLPVSRSRILARPQRHGHHLEMVAAARLLPRHLDRRSKGIGQTDHVLTWAERLGAIRIVG